MAITSFSNEYYFLSNFYISYFTDDNNNEWDCVERFFHAQKTVNVEDFRKIYDATTPKLAKQIGRRVKLRNDWENIKDEVMLTALKMKFMQNKTLADKLLATNEQRLVEGNTWHDNYWGDCSCSKCKQSGKNKLGLMLMQIRTMLKN